MIDKPDRIRKRAVARLREMGCSVDIIRGVGRRRGQPDILVGIAGETILVELKATKGAPIGKSQLEWRSRWRGGRVLVAWDVDMLAATIEEIIASAALRKLLEG